MNVNSWTDERLERLKQLHAEGWSFSRIAAALGGFEHCADEGRSAVIGKSHRLMLPRRERPSAALRAPRKPRNTFRKSTVRSPSIDPDLIAEPLSYSPNLDAFNRDIPIAQRKQLVDLTEDDCRFPVGDPGKQNFFFCAGPRHGERPYCKFHCGIAYQKPVYRPRVPWREIDRRKAA